MIQEFRNGLDTTVAYQCKILGTRQTAQLVKCGEYEEKLDITKLNMLPGSIMWTDDANVPRETTASELIMNPIPLVTSEKRPRGNPNWRKK